MPSHRRIDDSTRVAVLSSDSLGDQVLRAPLLQGLAARAGAVTVVVQQRVAALLSRIDPRLEALPTSLVPFRPGPDPAADAIEEDRLVAAIEAMRPDVIVHAPFVVHPGLERLLGRLSGHPRAGLADRERPEATAGLLDHAIWCGRLDHEAEKSVALLRGLIGDRAASAVDPRPRLRLRLGDRAAGRRAAESLGLDPGGYAIVVPGATANLAAKRWRAEGIAPVIARIARHHRLAPLIAGARAEAPLVAEVASECRRLGTDPPTWIGDEADLPTLLGLIADARLAVGVDSGPLHVAAALGVPVVASFSGAHWPRFLPAAERLAVVTRRLPCFDCNWSCWLEQPACLVHEPGPYLEAIGWALADGSPAVSIRGLRPDPELERRARAAVAEREGTAA